MDVMCRHCTKKPVNRPRGLCWGCYYAPGVRDLYPSTSKYAARTRDADGEPGMPPPDAPTTAAPGTPEKLLVMERRVRDKRAPNHPADARFEGDPRPLEFLAGGRRE